LNNNQKSLTPINLLPIDQGASILLTWVINFIKWNTGYNKFGEEAKLKQMEEQAEAMSSGNQLG